MVAIGDLSTEVLSQICGYLLPSGARKGDVASFSLVNKRFASVGYKYRFAVVHLDITSPDALAKELKELAVLLGSNHGLVQELRITGQMESNHYLRISNRTTVARDTFSRVDDGIEPCAYADYSTDADYVPKAPSCFQSKVFYRRRGEMGAAMNAAWEPLANFIGHLVRLKNLVWSCINRMPVSVLKALHEVSPIPPRLHMQSLNLRLDLFNDRLDPSTVMLLQSPCLSTLIIHVMLEDLYSSWYNSPTSMLDLQHSAPNLRSVCVWGWPVGGRERVPIHMTNRLNSQEPSNLLARVPTGPSLDTLVAFSDSTIVGLGDQLRDLTLTQRIPIDSVLRLATAAVLGQLPRLKALRLRTEMYYGPDAKSMGSNLDYSSMAREIKGIIMDEAISQLLDGLKPLETLELVGTLGEKSHFAVISRHGSTLKRLRFQPAELVGVAWPVGHFSVREIQSFALACQQLESLDMTLSEQLPETDKVEAIVELQKMPQLRHVCLDVCFSELSPPLQRSTSFEESYVHEDTPGGRVPAGSSIQSKAAVAIFKAASGARGAMQDFRIHIWGHCHPVLGVRDDMKLPHWVGYTWVCDRAYVGGDIYFQQIEKRKQPRYCIDSEMVELLQAGVIRKQLVDTFARISSRVQDKLRGEDWEDCFRGEGIE